MIVVALIEFYFKLIICITIPEEPKSKWGYATIKHISTRVVDGPFGSDLKVDEYQSFGHPLLRVSNIRNGEIDGDIVYISDEKQEQIKRSKVYPNDVILTKAGAILGYSAVFPEKLKEGNITSHLVTITCKDQINPYYLSHFFKSNLGQLQIYRWGNKSTRPELNTSEVKNIIITTPPLKIQSQIVEKLNLEHSIKKQKELEAQRLLDSIDDYLLGELGIELPEPEENTIKNRIFIRNLSEVSGDRFDPYPYQNKFKYLENKLKSMPIRVKKLKDIVSFFDYGLMPTQDYAFSDADGLPMIRVTNIKKDGYIDMSDIKYIKFDTPRLYQKLVKANDILMVQCGNTTGKCAFVTEEYEGYTFGSFSFVIRGDRNYVDQKYLFNILSSIVVQEQLNKSLTITSVRPNTSKPDVLNFKIPLPPLEKQIEISEHITAIRNQAKQLQQQAKDDLEKAKQEVEAMILGDD